MRAHPLNEAHAASVTSVLRLSHGAALIFFVHGLIADPTVTGRAIDYIDGEKVYVEICAALFVVVSAWRIRHRRARRRAELVRA